MMRGIWAACALVLVAGLCTAATGQAHAETLLFHASSSGEQTLDQGEGGGNPFATSLIDVLAQAHAELRDLPATLQRLTVQKSGGFQTPDVPAGVARPDWSLVPATSGERRIALVLVVSDYRSGGAPSLAGAKTDAQRIATALQRARFETEVALDLDLMSMRQKLADFATAPRNTTPPPSTSPATASRSPARSTCFPAAILLTSRTPRCPTTRFASPTLRVRPAPARSTSSSTAAAATTRLNK